MFLIIMCIIFILYLQEMYRNVSLDSYQTVSRYCQSSAAEMNNVNTLLCQLFSPTIDSESLLNLETLISATNHSSKAIDNLNCCNTKRGLYYCEHSFVGSSWQQYSTITILERTRTLLETIVVVVLKLKTGNPQEFDAFVRCHANRYFVQSCRSLKPTWVGNFFGVFWKWFTKGIVLT